MITHTQLPLECPHCGESRLIRVTIIDDAVGPIICEECIAQMILSRRTSRTETADRPASTSVTAQHPLNDPRDLDVVAAHHGVRAA